MSTKFAFVFPGQGSQAVGMLDSLKDEPVVQETMQEANEALGFDLNKLIAEGPAEDLNLTVNTQPALLVASIAMYRYYLSLGGKKPEVMAGHSLGEYTALVAAGALDFKEALKLVRYRAEQMQKAVPVGQGSMAAVLGLADEVVKDICAKASDLGVVEAVNFNTPGQVVIAGEVEALKKAMQLATATGARRALQLKVSGPFHSSLMKPAADALKVRLEEVEVNAPSIPVLHNIDVKTRTDAKDIKEALAAQAASAVLWAETVREMAKLGVAMIYECGPGAALSGMVKRITPDVKAMALNSQKALAEAAEQTKEQN